MPSSTQDPLAGVRAKIERAKEHISHLDGAIRAFLDTNPYAIRPERDAQTREYVYCATSVQDPPASIPLLFGDAVHNLRSALDHLAYQLFLAGPAAGTPAHHRRIYFPMSKDAVSLEARVRGKVQTLRPDAEKAILSLEPYKGGKGHRLWVLDELNNIDKHRLILTTGVVLTGVRIRSDALYGRSVRDLFPEEGDIPFESFPVRPDAPLKPLKAGDVVFVDATENVMHEKVQFPVGVAFCEPEVSECEPLIEAVHHFAGLVDGVVNELGPLV